LLRQVLTWLCLAAALVASPFALAQGKCKFFKVVDWPVKLTGNRIVVEGAINGAKVGLMLDTGATRSIISRVSAERLKLPMTEARGYRFMGVGGETKVYSAVVEEFKVGEAATKDLALLVAGERSFGEGADVLLGEDFLVNFDVEFDLGNNAVRLYRPQGCDGVSLAYWTKEVPGEVEIEPIDANQPRIEFTVQLNGKPVPAFLDSGSAASIVSLQDAAVAGVTPDSPGAVAGRRGSGIGPKTVEVWSGPFASFAIGNESIADIRLRFGDVFQESKYQQTGSSVTRRASPTKPMLLGADFLRAHRTLVSHSQRRLYFTYVGGPVFRAEPAPK
jgi:predicted aspartyl protease